MAAQFGNALEYTRKTGEKSGVDAPRSITLSTPILLLSLFSGQSDKPIFSQNASIAHQRLVCLGTVFCMRNLAMFRARSFNNLKRVLKLLPFTAVNNPVKEPKKVAARECVNVPRFRRRNVFVR